MEKLTFKQYLDSKEQLLKAIENTPISIIEYEVKKYCSLIIGESEEEKSSVPLKPKHKVIVEWRYTSIDNPSVESIKFEGVGDSEEEHSTFWTGTKLQKWLTRHTKQTS